MNAGQTAIPLMGRHTTRQADMDGRCGGGHAPVPCDRRWPTRTDSLAFGYVLVFARLADSILTHPTASWLSATHSTGFRCIIRTRLTPRGRTHERTDLDSPAVTSPTYLPPTVRTF